MRRAVCIFAALFQFLTTLKGEEHMKNLNTTGTFEDYIGSIAREIIRLLGTPPEGEKYYVKVKDGSWGPGTGIVKKITISDGTAFTSFSIAEVEFEKNSLCLVGDETKAKSVRLNNLAGARFRMAIEDLKDMVEPTITMIERLTAPEPEVFSGMSFEEIQTAADRLLSSNGYIDPDSNLGKVVMLIANLAARMKE